MKNIQKNALDIYKQLGKFEKYEIGCSLLCFSSIDSFIDSPTEEEYEVIANECYNTYLKMVDVDLVRLCDGICERYQNGQFTLEELKQMDKWEIMEMYDWS